MNHTNGTSAPLPDSGTEVPFDFFFSSKRFRADHSAHFRTQISEDTPLYLLCVQTLLIIAFLIGLWFSDFRWTLAGIIIIIFLIPLAGAYIYVSKLLTIKAYLALSPKHVSIDSNRNITIVYEKREKEDSDETDYEYPVHEPDYLPYESIERIRVSRFYLRVESFVLGYPLLIPLEAFPRGYDYKKLCSVPGIKSSSS